MPFLRERKEFTEMLIKRILKLYFSSVLGKVLKITVYTK